MGYYGQFRGDYYRGDYYQGDPFWGFLGKIAKGVGGLLGVGGGTSTSAITKAVQTGMRSGALEKVGPILTRAKGIITKHKGLIGGVAALGAAGALGRASGRMGMGGGGGGRRRRMNVCNPRALRRSIRRTQGFAKLAMRTIHLVHPKKRARFGGFKKRTRRAAR
jgi:hypothetical protein